MPQTGQVLKSATPAPACNPPDPNYGLRRQGRGVVSKTVHETVHAQRQAQRAGRETPLLPATGCEQSQCATKNADDPKSKESTTLDAPLPPDATGCEERRRRDSNPGWRICNPLPNPLNPEENGPQGNRLAQRLAPETGNGPIDLDLAQLIEAWNTLDCDAREAVLAIINSMKRGETIPAGNPIRDPTPSRGGYRQITRVRSILNRSVRGWREGSRFVP